MTRLRTAIVGLGRIGWQFHLPAVKEHESQFELVGVVDPLAERLTEAASQFGARGYDTLPAMLAAEKPQLVVIASPTKFHPDHALAAFAAGADVFSDKPLAASLAEAERMVAGAQQAGRKLMIYQPHRVTQECQSIRALLARDLIGKPFLLKRTCSRYARRNDWQALTANGGGMLNNYGAHFIDQTLYLAGSAPKRSFGALRTAVSVGDADDVVKLVLELESGMLVDLDINQAAAQTEAPWVIHGPRGSITQEAGGKAWLVKHVPASDLPPLTLQSGLAASGRQYGTGEVIPWQDLRVPIAETPALDYYDLVHAHFARGEAPFVPLSETLQVMRVMHECRRQNAG
jgi:scyllo-inositol 2-dehydrogenase (NADP+)